MSYDAIIEQVKAVPENRLEELVAFIGYLKFSSNLVEKQNLMQSQIPASKQAFFDAVGKLSFDKAAVENLRTQSMI